MSFAPLAPPMYASTPMPAAQTLFLLCPEGWFGDMHPAPRRQFDDADVRRVGVVWGGEDRVVPAAYVDEFTRLVPHATAAICRRRGLPAAGGALERHLEGRRRLPALPRPRSGTVLKE